MNVLQTCDDKIFIIWLNVWSQCVYLYCSLFFQLSNSTFFQWNFFFWNYILYFFKVHMGSWMYFLLWSCILIVKFCIYILYIWPILLQWCILDYMFILKLNIWGILLHNMHVDLVITRTSLCTWDLFSTYRTCLNDGKDVEVWWCMSLFRKARLLN